MFVAHLTAHLGSRILILEEAASLRHPSITSIIDDYFVLARPVIMSVIYLCDFWMLVRQVDEFDVFLIAYSRLMFTFRSRRKVNAGDFLDRLITSRAVALPKRAIAPCLVALVPANNHSVAWFAAE
jgi:hypothetical protein